VTENGTVSVAITSQETPGAAIVTALHGFSEQSALIRFVGTPAAIGVSAEDGRMAADGTSETTITISVTDEADNPVLDGTEVHVATTAGALDTSTLQTEGGTATVILTTGEEPSEAVVSAAYGDVSGETTVVVVGEPASLSLAADPPPLVPDAESETWISLLMLRMYVAKRCLILPSPL
jgi:hypothetical protein